MIVSIRSRLFSREILPTAAVAGADSAFQSAPGFLAGRYARLGEEIGRLGQFQSAPGFLAGRYNEYALFVSSRGRCFNPLPAF